MKRLVVLSVLSVVALSPAAADAAVDHCPDHNTEWKIGRPARDHVPTAGSEVCVKAGTGNTGRIVADGTATLADYLRAAGITGGNGEGRDPSYLVIYRYVPPTTTTTTPEEEPSTTTTSTQPPGTTTTTAPPATTTTTTPPAPPTPGTPVTTSTTVAGPATSEKPVPPSGGETPAPSTEEPPSPLSPASPVTELPATGTGSTLLLVLGTWLFISGLSALAIAQLIRGAK